MKEETYAHKIIQNRIYAKLEIKNAFQDYGDSLYDDYSD